MTAAGTDTVVSTDHETHMLFIRALVMLSLILIAMNVNVFLKKREFHYVSETAVYILLGLITATGWTAISYDEENTAIQLNSKFFYMVLLPPIIFEGGFSLQRISFFQNILSILSLAFIGALYSTFVTSVLMYFFSKLITPWSFIESLVFGSLISSTDPVTVLSLLPSNVDRRLYMLIFGESALNDAVSIILYRFFTGLADPHMRLGVGPFILSVIASAGVFIGSTIVGIIFGLIVAKITKHVMLDEHEAGTYEMVMVIVFAYSSYLLADVLGLTGIISVFICGITMAHYAYNNLEVKSRDTLKVTLRMFSFMCECFIFLYLGLGLLSFGGKTTYSPMFIFFAVLSILISRTHVFIILGFGNLAIKDKADRVPFNYQFLIWFSGLRGAVAFALGVSFLEHPVFSEEVKGVIFGTTVMVVVFTVIVLGTLTPHMLRWLKISGPEAEGHGHHAGQVEGKEAGGGPGGDLELKKIEAGAGEGMIHKTAGGHEYGHLQEEDEEANVREMEAKAKKQPLFAWLYKLDAKYIRPHFTTLTEGNLQTLTSIAGDEMERAAILAAASAAGGVPQTPAGPGARSRKQSMLNVSIDRTQAPFTSTVSSPALAGPLGILEKAKSSYAGPSGLGNESLRAIRSPSSSQQDVVVMESVDLGK